MLSDKIIVMTRFIVLESLDYMASLKAGHVWDLWNESKVKFCNFVNYRPGEGRESINCHANCLSLPPEISF